MSKTYSLPQIWNLNAQALNDSVSEELVEPVPVSADAWLRARARAARAGLAWATHPGSWAFPVDDVDYSAERRAYNEAQEVPC